MQIAQIILKTAQIFSLQDDLLCKADEWIKEYEVKNVISFELKKKACLNVPIFKTVFEDKKDVTSIFELRDYFRSIAPVEIEDKKIGSALRRYLDGMYNIKISESKMRKLSQRKQLKLISSENEKKENYNPYNKLIILSEKLNEIEKEFSIEEINTVLKIRHPEL